MLSGKHQSFRKPLLVSWLGEPRLCYPYSSLRRQWMPGHQAPVDRDVRVIGFQAIDWFAAVLGVTHGSDVPTSYSNSQSILGFPGVHGFAGL